MARNLSTISNTVDDSEIVLDPTTCDNDESIPSSHASFTTDNENKQT